MIGSRLDGEFGAVGTTAAAPSRREAADGGDSGSGGGSSGSGKPCRLAFYGTLLESLRPEDVRRLRVYKHKTREGTVHRLGDTAGGGAGADGVVRIREATGQGLFKKETDLRPFLGMRVETRDGQLGRVEAGFGKGGKFRVRFEGAGAAGVKPGDRLYLRFQRFVHDPEKRMVQPETPLPPVGGRGKAPVGAEGPGDGGGGGGGGGGDDSSSSSGGGQEEEEEGEEEEDGDGAGVDGGVVDGVDLSALEMAAAGLALHGPGHQLPPPPPLPLPPPPQQARAAAQQLLAGQSMPSSAASGPTSSLNPLGTPSVVPAPAVPGSGSGGPPGGGGLQARYGVVDAVRAGDLVIAKGFFTMEEDVRQYVGMRVVVTDGGGGGGGSPPSGAEGCVVGPFGKGGKAKVQFSGSFGGGVGTPLTLYVERGP